MPNSNPMNWFRDLWWRWQSRRFTWRFQCSKAAEMSDRDLLYYAAGNGHHPVFARACQYEARRRLRAKTRHSVLLRSIRMRFQGHL